MLIIQVCRKRCTLIQIVNSKTYLRLSLNLRNYKGYYCISITIQAFVDFGSDNTYIKESVAHSLNLIYNGVSSAMKGFGNEVVYLLWKLILNLFFDDVSVDVVCKVVSDE